MFKMRLETKDFVKPKVGIYFIYDEILYKVIKVIDNKHYQLALYDESRGVVVKFSFQFSVDDIWKFAIFSGKYKIIEPTNGEIRIPDKLRYYVV